MSDTDDVVANLHCCWDSLDGLLADLSDVQWWTRSLCPDWTVHGVVSHLAAVEHMLTGEAPGSMTEQLPFAKVGEFLAEAAQLDPSSLLTRYRAIIDTRRAELAALSDGDMELPSLTPVGPGTYGRFMAIRVFDFWVHEQDIRVPLGLKGNESGSAAEMAIDEIDASLGYIVGKKIGLPDGKSITIELGGPVQRAMHVVVDGRATRVDHLDSPDVVLRTDSTTFALLACGRVDPRAQIKAGRISWTGDDRWGRAAASGLAFTM